MGDVVHCIVSIEIEKYFFFFPSPSPAPAAVHTLGCPWGYLGGGGGGGGSMAITANDKNNKMLW